jgi:hypothetical protein
VGAINPLVQGTTAKSIYPRSLAAHALGSVLAGALAGGGVGWLGGQLPVVDRLAWWPGLGLLAGLLVLRELGWLRFPIPQVRRQTVKTWFPAASASRAAFWWGLDLGSGLTTLVTFSGYWLIVAAAVLKGDAAFGALLLGGYGLGRSLPIVLVPMTTDCRRTLQPEYVGRVIAYRPRLRRWHLALLTATTLGLLAGVLRTWLG